MSRQMPASRSNRRRRRNRQQNGQLQPYVASIGYQTPFPNRMTVQEFYSDQFNFVSTSGVFTVNEFRMNSTFDPDLSGTGHQPYGRDKLVAVYGKYRVTHFRAEATVACTTASGTTVCAIAPSAASGAFSSCQAMAESPYGQLALTNFYGSAVTLKSPWISLAAFQGQSEPEFIGDDSNESVTTTNPTATPIWSIGAQNTAAQTTNSNVVVKLWYRVVYFFPITEATS